MDYQCNELIWQYCSSLWKREHNMPTAVYHEGVCMWGRQDLGHIDVHANWCNSVHTHRTSLSLSLSLSLTHTHTHTHAAVWLLKHVRYGCEGSGLKLNGYVCCKHMRAHWFWALWGMCPLENVWFTVDVTVQHVGKMDYMFPCTKLKSLDKIAVWKEFERKKGIKNKEKVKKEQTLGRRKSPGQ